MDFFQVSLFKGLVLCNMRDHIDAVCIGTPRFLPLPHRDAGHVYGQKRLRGKTDEPDFPGNGVDEESGQKVQGRHTNG